MEKVPPDQLRIAKDNLDISILDPICLKTISSRLVKGLKKNPKEWETLNESALVLMQSLTPRPNEDKLDVEGKDKKFPVNPKFKYQNHNCIYFVEIMRLACLTAHESEESQGDSFFTIKVCNDFGSFIITVHNK